MARSLCGVKLFFGGAKFVRSEVFHGGKFCI